MNVKGYIGMASGPRKYHSPARRQQAQDTRGAITKAARTLLLAQGYAATTIEQIAREAGYAAPTVYAAFASKQGILAALVEEASFGDAYEDIVQHAQQIADPAERLTSAARIARTIFEADRAELDFLRGAGVVSPDIAIKEREREARRFARQEQVIAFVESTGRLKDGVDPKAARDMLWALTSRDLFRLLVVVQGWHPDRYEDWLGALLVDQLLAPAPPD